MTDGDLEQLVAFLNTVDVEDGTDVLGDPDEATRWAVAQGLLPEGAMLDGDELEQARALRAALRQLALAHHEGHVDPEATAAFEEIADALPLRATVDAAGRVGLDAPGEGGTAALARLVGAVVLTAATDRWQRVKLCPAEDCRWAFVDQSKNRSRRWCAMGVCGNRQKTRSYRERHREQPG